MLPYRGQKASIKVSFYFVKPLVLIIAINKFERFAGDFFDRV